MFYRNLAPVIPMILMFRTSMELIGHQQLKENIKATKEWQEMGNLFIFATGRPISLMKIEQKIHGLVYDYIVGLNGAVIVSSDGQVVFRQIIMCSKFNNLSIFKNCNSIAK